MLWSLWNYISVEKVLMIFCVSKDRGLVGRHEILEQNFPGKQLPGLIPG